MSHSPSVFIVDDDKIYTYVLCKQFRNLGVNCATEIFVNGQEALERLRSHADSPEGLPDIILLDINMPVMDGWQFLDEYQSLQTAKNITIHMVSSSIDTADVRKASAYPQVSNFYVKPISREVLAEILQL